MFDNSAGQMRQYYYDAWAKFQNHLPLNTLEKQVVAVIKDHPEYQQLLQCPKQKEQNFSEGNPFLHMGLHLALRDQISTNRPVGIQTIFHALTKKHGPLEAEHQMMESLAEALWNAQRNQRLPDEKHYLLALKRLI